LIAAPGANKYINVVNISDSFVPSTGFSCSDFPTVVTTAGHTLSLITSLLGSGARMEKLLYNFANYITPAINTAILLRGGAGEMNVGAGDLKLKIFIYYTIEDIS
jgi:hypothetical protein